MPSTERRGEQRARAEREFAENERTSDALALLAWPCGSGPAELTRLMSPTDWPGTLTSLRRHRTNLTIWRYPVPHTAGLYIRVKKLISAARQTLSALAAYVDIGLNLSLQTKLQTTCMAQDVRTPSLR